MGCLRTSSAFMLHIVIVSRAYGGREAEPIDHRLEPEFGTERRPQGRMTSVGCLRTGTAFLLHIVIVSRAYGGREAKPIDHRLEPKFGTDDVPKGM